LPSFISVWSNEEGFFVKKSSLFSTRVL